MEILTGLTVTPLSPVLGAEISGINITKDLTPDVVEDLRAIWQEHLVLVFRGQDLSLEQQLKFASNFGELGERKRVSTAFKKSTEGIYQTDPYSLLVSNIKVDGKPIGAFGEGDMWFHIDSGYSERPYKFTFLYGLELPATGGNTLFSNGYKAYDSLPDDIKHKIAGRKALHIHEYKRSEKVDTSGDISNSPHWYHPVAVTHPETGRKALFVDRLMTSSIEGMDPDESEKLLNQLLDHAEKPELVFEHVWQLKDFVMFDNRCVTHGRSYFAKDQNRLLRRCTIEGEPLSE